jgi:hypothetical protein
MGNLKKTTSQRQIGMPGNLGACTFGNTLSLDARLAAVLSWRRADSELEWTSLKGTQVRFRSGGFT